MRRGDKQKLQIEKLTTDFKDALQRYFDMQKINVYMRYEFYTCYTISFYKNFKEANVCLLKIYKKLFIFINKYIYVKYIQNKSLIHSTFHISYICNSNAYK